jgi:hypothetical protein
MSNDRIVKNPGMEAVGSTGLPEREVHLLKRALNRQKPPPKERLYDFYSLNYLK